MPPLVALGFLCRGVNLQAVGAFRVPAWANFCATFALSVGRSYCVRSPASTALSQASKSFSSCGDRFKPLYLAIRSASVILLLMVSPLFLFSRAGIFHPALSGLGHTEQGLTLFLRGHDTAGHLELTHQRRHFLIAKVSQGGHELQNLRAGHAIGVIRQSRQVLHNLLLERLVLLLGRGQLLIARAGVLLGKQFQLVVNDSHRNIHGRAIGHRLPGQQGLNVLETLALSDTDFLLAHNNTSFLTVGRHP